MKKLLVGTAISGVLLASAAAYAQGIQLPQLNTVGTNDLIQDIPNGVPSAGNQYVTAAQIAGVPGYTKTVPLTAFSLTFANSQEYMLLRPAGTLATGTITTAANPSDGQRECMRSSQTQTALTFQANTGQTITAAITAMTANTNYCYTYSISNSTWDPS